jgi:AP-1-like transcription factor
MTTFNSPFDWDSNISPAISSLDENDFLLLLQKQFPSVNVAPIAPSVLAKGKPDEGANPQALTKFQMPNTTSPLSTDSSPSPPSANDDNASFNGSDGNSNNVNSKGGSPTDEDHHKRKASADDFDDEINGQPSAKSQHTDPKSKKTLQTRRKSGGGEKGQVGCSIKYTRRNAYLCCVG